MIRKLSIALMGLVSFGIYGQNGTVSPYSYFGLGDIRTTGTVENQMMGDIGVYADSIHVNLKNPAAYAELGVPFGDDFGTTVYTAGVSRQQYRLRTALEEDNSSVTNLDYLSLAFSLGRGLGMGFGLMPYTAVGYDLTAEGVSGEQSVINLYSGEGGLNRVYYTLGYEVVKNLSVGATVNFNFGTLSNQRLQQIEDVQFGTFDRRSSRINGFDFNYALMYAPTFKNKHTLRASVRVNTQGNLVSKNERTIGSFFIATGNNIEEVEVDLEAQNLRNTEFKVPTATTVGIGYGRDRSWFLGAEYTMQGLSAFENPFLGVENATYEDASSYALGGFFIPDAGSFSSYLKRITYRAGLRLDRTGMVVNNESISNFGITFGVGLPLPRSYSNLNIGVELGRRGTTKADLVEESYLKINVGLSLNDNWFRKRKID
ncbi:hypothetical protein [Maribacter sp. 2307ULW6-5]|uniref:hypothetical protein n=1 Tax=Maribacter sp. 2307ULW6-5 TaxID=3386275 RepID=UPI0039BD4B69